MPGTGSRPYVRLPLHTQRGGCNLMRSPNRRRIILICLAAAAVVLTAAVILSVATAGPACNAGRCTLYDHGVAVAGRCGRKKGDSTNCYCLRLDGALTDHTALVSVTAAPQEACRQ
jgi:hypothetical protein